MTIEELTKKLQELQASLPEQNAIAQQTGWYGQPLNTCPSCGYCPHCGRGGHQTQPYYPSYPYPYWGAPYCGDVTYGTLTGGYSLGTVATN